MVAVIARPEHTVRIVFADGEVRDVDITPLLHTTAFAPLRDPALFDQVQVDDESGTIVWPGDIDLDPDVIYAAEDLGPDKGRESTYSHRASRLDTARSWHGHDPGRPHSTAAGAKTTHRASLNRYDTDRSR